MLASLGVSIPEIAARRLKGMLEPVATWLKHRLVS
jgi:hypothetical protein